MNGSKTWQKAASGKIAAAAEVSWPEEFEPRKGHLRREGVRHRFPKRLQYLLQFVQRREGFLEGSFGIDLGESIRLDGLAVAEENARGPLDNIVQRNRGYLKWLLNETCLLDDVKGLICKALERSKGRRAG